MRSVFVANPLFSGYNGVNNFDFAVMKLARRWCGGFRSAGRIG
jgi:hypothetical protein